jgi:hypothetical protein
MKEKEGKKGETTEPWCMSFALNTLVFVHFFLILFACWGKKGGYNVAMKDNLTALFSKYQPHVIAFQAKGLFPTDMMIIKMGKDDQTGQGEKIGGVFRHIIPQDDHGALLTWNHHPHPR